MGKQRSFRSKAAHFVSDLTTVLLNPISDKTSKPPPDDASGNAQLDSVTEEDSGDLVDGPDTTSFTAFMYSLLSSTKPENLDDKYDDQVERGDQPSDTMVGRGNGKKSLLSRGKQSLRWGFYQVARISGSQNQEQNHDSGPRINHEDDSSSVGVEMGRIKLKREPGVSDDHPEISEPSMLLSAKTMNTLYSSLPALVQGRRWFLLYSTWRHGISLGTLYRRSMLWPGLSLLVVGDRKGAVFGGLVEAPLRPTNKRYQGTNSTFVFTNKTGHPIIFRPTGANRYFTLCARDYLAIGGGGHFALYLDSELLSGSSSVSETYGNPCLAHSEDFEVKEVELWGFVYASKYDEVLGLSKTEEHGICRW